MKKKSVFTVLIILAVIVIALPYAYKSYKVLSEKKAKQLILRTRAAEWERLRLILEREVAAFKGEAGIVVRDLDTDSEISFNKRKKCPSASLVKVPIMLAAFSVAQEGKLNLNKAVAVKAASKTGGSGTLKNFIPGTTVTVKELIELMITGSDNTATNILIDLLGFDYLNAYFEKIGLKNTNLSRKMMDFEYRKKGIENYTTAEDMSTLLDKLYKKELFNEEITKQCISLLKNQKYNDRIPGQLPYWVTAAHKTGLEKEVCHDIGIVFAPRGNYSICVLTVGQKNSKIAKEFISNISFQVYNCYNSLEKP